MISIYRTFIVLAYIFFSGCILGWFIEFFFRRFKKANKEHVWYNPGFLTGPWLPIYGFGAMVLFVLSSFEQYVVKVCSSGAVYYVIMFLVMALFMTLVEYIAGKIFINGMHIKLWDYSKEWGNIQGIVCPKFTLYWGVLSAIYYFLLFPKFQMMVLWFIDHPWFSFTVGTVFGLFLVDFAFAVRLGALLRKQACSLDRKAALDFQKLQGKLRMNSQSIHSKGFLENKFDQFEDFIQRSPAAKDTPSHD